MRKHTFVFQRLALFAWYNCLHLHACSYELHKFFFVAWKNSMPHLLINFSAGSIIYLLCILMQQALVYRFSAVFTWSPLVKYGVVKSDHIVGLFLDFWETSKPVSTEAGLVSILTSSGWGCPLPHPCRPLFFVSFLSDLLAGVRWHLSVIYFPFSWWLVRLSIFSYVYWQFIIPLWKTVCSLY